MPGPHWGSLQRSPDPLAGGEGARHPRTPASALWALPTLFPIIPALPDTFRCH